LSTFAEQRQGAVGTKDLIALSLALGEWEALDERDRRRRDREIGEGGTGLSGIAALRNWLAIAPTVETQNRIRRVGSGLRAVHGILGLVGLFFGWATAAALLQMEVHAGRINIVFFLATVVIFPGVLWLAALIGVVWSGKEPESARRAETSRRSLRDGLLVRLALALMPGSVRADAEVFFGRAAFHNRSFARARDLQFFVWSQWMAFAFSAGALLSTLTLVVFTDLAFGWSTTLDLGAESVHRITSTASLPWSGIWADAVPSLDLVERTRHFRVAGPDAHVHFIDPILFGAWWPFLVMATLTYGALPRLFTSLVGALALKRASEAALLAMPGARRVLEGLSSPLVETQAKGSEGPIGLPAAGQVDSVTQEAWVARHAGSDLLVIAWAEALADEALRLQFPREGLRLRDAGGRRSLAEDAERVAEARAGDGGVAVIVRAYEPPMLELVDFLSDLRRAMGSERGLAVGLFAGDSGSHEAWRRKLYTMGDPGLVTFLLSNPGDDARSELPE